MIVAERTGSGVGRFDIGMMAGRVPVGQGRLRRAAGGGSSWSSPSLAATVGEDEFVGGGLELLDGGLGQHGVGHESEPLDGFAVGGGDGDAGAVALDDAS